MSENQAANEVPTLVPSAASWKVIFLRAAGFGCGFAIVAAILLGGAIWWSSRPKQWSDKSITAKSTQLMMQQTGDELRFEFRYAFTNHTNAEYALPAADMGALMRKLPKEGSFDKLDAAGWDATIRIPPQQSIGVTFTVPYKLVDYNISGTETLSDTKLAEFAGNRLKNIDGLVFFDYAAKYKVEMPRSWDQPKEPEKK